ncbi:MAG: apolipoprotein N-acyltransferase [Deltaproteobacteria bacterium]|nr:apolipoprotein N-acyltransferase [Deltaproteobacteria bacterium]
MSLTTRRWVVTVIAAVSAPCALYASQSVERAWPLSFVVVGLWAMVVFVAPRWGALLGALSLAPGYAAMHRVIAEMSWLAEPLIQLGFGLSLLVTAAIVRAIVKRSSVPLALLLPVLWAGGELVRSLGIIPPWHWMAEGMYAQLWAIQICDLGGMPLLSMALACSGGALAALVLHRAHPTWRPRPARMRSEITVALCVWLFVGLYGVWRLQQAKHTVREGPRVLLIHSEFAGAEDRNFGQHQNLRGMAQRTHAALAQGVLPEVIVWPESVLDGVIDPGFLQAESLSQETQRRALPQGSLEADVRRAALQSELARGRVRLPWVQQHVRRAGVPMLVGGPGRVQREGVWRRTNSVYWVRPEEGSVIVRHDKTEPFPIYERLPFEDATAAPLRPLRALFAQAQAANPEWPGSIVAGTDATLFALGQWRFAAPICFETEYASFANLQSIRAENRPDFWINVADDGWAKHRDDSVRAFRFNVFRAVESRVGIARSSNAGVTGFTSPTGEIHGVVGGAAAAQMPSRLRDPRGPRHQITVDRVRVDSRRTVYAALRGASDLLVRALWLLGFCWWILRGRKGERA